MSSRRRTVCSPAADWYHGLAAQGHTFGVDPAGELQVVPALDDDTADYIVREIYGADIIALLRADQGGRIH